MRTPQRMYSLPGSGEWSYAGRRWVACRPAVWLLVAADRLDGDHFGHWAADHGEAGHRLSCSGRRCPECGGIYCGL